MLSNEERIIAMHGRAIEIKREKRAREVRAIQILAFAGCFLLIITAAVFVPDVGGGFAANSAQNSMNASIFTEGTQLGYIVTGILAFIFGCGFTVLCFRLRKWQHFADAKELRDSEDTDNGEC